MTGGTIAAAMARTPVPDSAYGDRDRLRCERDICSSQHETQTGAIPPRASTNCPLLQRRLSRTRARLGHRDPDLRRRRRPKTLIEVALVRHPDLVPQTRVIPPERRVAPHAPTLSGRKIDIAPDREVQRSDRLRMEETDEIHDEDLPGRNRLRITECSGTPIKPPEHARLTIAERPEYLPDEAGPLDPIPIRRSTVRPRWIEEVVASHPHAPWDQPEQVPRERGLSCAAIAGNPHDNRAATFCATACDRPSEFCYLHPNSITEPQLMSNCDPATLADLDMLSGVAFGYSDTLNEVPQARGSWWRNPP